MQSKKRELWFANELLIQTTFQEIRGKIKQQQESITAEYMCQATCMRHQLKPPEKEPSLPLRSDFPGFPSTAAQGRRAKRNYTEFLQAAVE